MGISVWQILIVLVIVLIVFGAGKLPRVMGDFGKGIKNFKSGLKEEEEASSAPKEIDQTVQPTVETTKEKDGAAKS